VMPYRTAENVIDGLVITFVDITKLKNSDILLAAYIASMGQIAKKASLKEILDTLVYTLEKQAIGIACSISLLDEDSKQLRLAIAPTLPEGFNKGIKTIAVGPDATWPSAMAAHQRKHFIVADIASDMAKTEFAELTGKFGIKACWSQPIYDKAGKILGVFTMYYPQSHQPSQIEKDLINKAIPLMATALSFHSGTH
jgi:GAF domain-containing protein